MTTKYWIKLYMEILDDPKMGRLPDHLWRCAVELFLLAGRHGNDGALPPVDEMAWTLRLSDEQLLEDLRGLAEVGVVMEAEPGRWVVTNFSKRQAAVPVEERVRNYRVRNSGVTREVTQDDTEDVTKRYESCNEVAAGPSVSTSVSDSDSSEEGCRGGNQLACRPRRRRRCCTRMCGYLRR